MVLGPCAACGTCNTFAAGSARTAGTRDEGRKCCLDPGPGARSRSKGTDGAVPLRGVWQWQYISRRAGARGAQFSFPRLRTTFCRPCSPPGPCGPACGREAPAADSQCSGYSRVHTFHRCRGDAGWCGHTKCIQNTRILCMRIAWVIACTGVRLLRRFPLGVGGAGPTLAPAGPR